MEQPTPRTTAAMPWLLLLCLAAAATSGILLQARAQLDSNGFISIACGLTGETSYVDTTTKLSYTTDVGFTDAGVNGNISDKYITPSVVTGWYTVRSFPVGIRSCYTLRSLESGLKYLIRATFLYGNYDGLDRPPIFDLYVGVNFFKTVKISKPDEVLITEAIVVVPDDFVQVCLVNTGTGTPFISGLDLRPLKSTLYPQVNATQGLVLVNRSNFGPTDTNTIVRYPDDPHDRIWFPLVDVRDWDEVSTTKTVQNNDINDPFEEPTTVMQTAIKPRNASKNIQFTLDLENQPSNPTPGYMHIMYFAELQELTGNAIRQFYVNRNGELLEDAQGQPLVVTPAYLRSDETIYSLHSTQYSNYDVSLDATANSTLPPIINAIELFYVISTTNVGTDSQDVSSITAIKEKYEVHKNWRGDPCLPKELAWDGLNCSYVVSRPPAITDLNLSSSGLNGDISSFFGRLKAVQYLDLSNNNLIGPIPDILSQLPSLIFLDLSNNKLNGSIPSGLVKKIQDGSLDLRYGNNPDLCTNGNSCQPAEGDSKLAIYIAVPVVVIVVLVLVTTIYFCLQRKKKQGSTKNSLIKPTENVSSTLTNDGYGESSFGLQSRHFTFMELEMITNNFQRVLGQGGFGYVFHGSLEDGTQVAVKLRSHSSNQGVKQFLAEAQVLTRIHHKNLVSMIGYCKDGKHMALVYEYMPEGTLQDHIAVKDSNGRGLPWRQRLRIALESAQGLEYLHKGCNPPIIHRDVKATNILLSARLEAKIADFGLSKAFNCDDDTHVSTNTFVGTPGYVDPEYQRTMQPSTKSDVYSFGVVLLQLVTGKLAILRNPEPINIINWARQRLGQGDIEGVVDARMQGDHDINAVWKATDIALMCTRQAPPQRPSMTDVVMQLQECLQLEEGCTGGDDEFYAGNGSGGMDPNLGYNATTYRSIDVSQINTTFEIGHNYKRAPTMDTGPATR